MIKVSGKVIAKAARIEDASVKEIKKGVADGTVVVLKNRLREFTRPCAVGKV